MTKDELKSSGIVFFADCHAIQIRERLAGPRYPGKEPHERINPLVVIWTQDDERWSESMAFGAAWLPELIKIMKQASEIIEVEWPEKGKLNEVVKC